MRVRTAALLALAVLQAVVLVDVSPAGASQAALERARRQANNAATELARAKSRLSDLESQLADLEARQAENAQRMASLEGAVRQVAVERYIRGRGRHGIADVDPADASATVRATALADIVASGAEDAVDEYRAAAEDHALAASRLTVARRAAGDALDAVRERARAANQLLARLQALEAERIERERAQRAAAARSARTSRAAGPTASRPRSTVIGSGSWICPVQGPRAFTNDWGQPRSGGRRHQGTDILAPRGTPVVAPVAGSARTHNSRLGGLSVYLVGADGNTYFGTHLDGVSGNTGRVAAGTVLGYVGNSGNARGGPTHLHFEIHPGGGRPVNPYPTLARYC